MMFWVFKQAGPNTVSNRKSLELATGWAKPRSTQIFNCDIDLQEKSLHNPVSISSKQTRL